MRTEKDFEDLLELLNKHKVRYCIVGSYALALYARPRYTKDMDILVDPSVQNACRIVKALGVFGFAKAGLEEKDFSSEGKIVQLGYEPVRVVILTSIAGCSFDEVWKSRERARYGKQRVFFIGKKALIKNKESAGRPQDKVDVQELRRRR